MVGLLRALQQTAGNAAVSGLLQRSAPELQRLSQFRLSGPFVQRSPVPPAANLPASKGKGGDLPLDMAGTPEGMDIAPEAGLSGDLQSIFQANLAKQLALRFGPGATVASVKQRIAEYRLSGDEEGGHSLAETWRTNLWKANEYALVETLKVDKSGRYQPIPGKTFCNVYATDFVRALGAYLPKVWWVNEAQVIKDTASGKPVTAEYGKNVSSLTANGLDDWLHKWGSAFGWTKVTAEKDAQAAADNGTVVVASAHSKKGSKISGHVSVVIAQSTAADFVDKSSSSAYVAQAHRDASGAIDAPLQTQAGQQTIKYGYDRALTNTGTPGSKPNRFWDNAAHDPGGFWVHSAGREAGAVATPEDLGAAAPGAST